MIDKDRTLKFDQEPLCYKCTNGQVAKGMKFHEHIVYCHRFEKMLEFDVYECSSYSEPNTQSLYEMRLMAWELALKGDKVIGFMSPNDFKKLCDEGKIDKPAPMHGADLDG